MIGSTGTTRIDSCRIYELKNCKELFSAVILSGVAASRSEGDTESKDPYKHPEESPLSIQNSGTANC